MERAWDSRAEIATVWGSSRKGLAWNGSRIEMTFPTEGGRKKWHWEKGRPVKYACMDSSPLDAKQSAAEHLFQAKKKKRFKRY